MAVIYSNYKDKYVDLDKEEEYDVCDVVYDFANELDFNEELYNNCSFAIEYDDYRKWIVIEDTPNAKLFYEDLIDFAEEGIGRKLEESEKQELIDCFEQEYATIVNDCEEWLIDRYREAHNGD